MDPLSQLVSDDGALVSRQLYYDPEIYRIERQRVFGRSWLFLGHQNAIDPCRGLAHFRPSDVKPPFTL